VTRQTGRPGKKTGDGKRPPRNADGKAQGPAGAKPARKPSSKTAGKTASNTAGKPFAKRAEPRRADESKPPLRARPAAPRVKDARQETRHEERQAPRRAPRNEPAAPAAKPRAAKTPAPQPAPAGVQNIAIVADEDGMRLDRWFRRRWPAMGLSHLNKICRKGEVRVDGKRVEASDRVKTGNVVRVPPINIDIAAPAVKRAPEASPQDAKLIREITLFEDRKLLVLNKPWGLAVQGGSGTTRHIDGMLQGMAEEMGERPVLVHRLDRDTSGVLLIAKTRKMAADLGEIFRSRQARKIYWAIVEGVPKPLQGRISLFLAKGAAMADNRSRSRWRDPDEPVRIDPEKMRIAKHGEQDAQHSVTFYATVDKVAPRLAWLSMKPITGRTHQLRAHAEAIGHPIIGDPKYHGDFAPNDPRRTDPMRAIPPEVERKLHLLARRLVLPNPSGGMLDVTAPLPPHMKKTFNLFGFDEKQYDPIEDAPEE
jgi:23S rRNA pseudouridine955/2504/2580 synthase